MWKMIIKILRCLVVVGILMSMVPFLVAAANDDNTTDKTTNPCPACSKRPAPIDEVAITTTKVSLAPGYCSSTGGSHGYEYISSVTYTQNPSNTTTITVDIYIANPSGCTYGNPCPEYDESPEYINAWIDWNGDKTWDSSEIVMDEALTGYVDLNYQGMMTASTIVTTPADAVSSTWMRVNLGWGYDPNDPCEESWSWGDVVDKEVIVKPEITDFKVDGGLSRYEGKYKNIVFRRGDDNPRFEVTASVPADDKVKVDVFKNGNTLATLDAVLDANKGIYVAMWDWKSKTWSKIPDEIPVGEYKAKAKITTEEGIELVSSDEKEFYVIFDTPKGLSDAEKRAYLCGDSKGDRYIKGNHYGYRNSGSTKFSEKEYYLEPVNEHIFNISIHVVDSIVEETTAAEKLCTMVHNIIKYSKPHNPQDVPKMLKNVSVEDAIKASEGQKINKIEGQCLDYGNTLTSVLRSVGVSARPATGIWYNPHHTWAYHVWTETYVPEASGADPWYVYDGTLDSQSTRISVSWGKDASEVAVGNEVWKIDGGILKRTDRKITRYNSQANDILFEKCENKKYNDSGCSKGSSLIKSLGELSNCSINLTLDKYLTRVGAPVVANITVDNYEDETTTFKLNSSIYAFDPSSPIIGYDRLIDCRIMDVTIPANSNITLQQTFLINATNYPYETYIVEVTGTSENNSCNDTASLEVLPAFNINIALPDDINITDQIPITITICNNVSFAIENMTLQIDIPAEYSTNDELIKNIPLLIPGACDEDYLIIIPTEEDFFPIAPLYFTVNSNNGGNYSASLYKELVEGAKLDVGDEYILFDGEFGEPFGIGFELKNIGDLAATNVLAEITLPEDVTATEITWNIGDLADGENVSLYTNVTFTKPEDFIIDVFVSDDTGNNASGVVYVHILSNLSANFDDLYLDYGLDTNGDGMYEYLVAEVGINVTNAGIGGVEGWLCDSSGTEIVKAENSSYLSTGDHSVLLEFGGFDIYKHGINGSYDLKDLKLFNETGVIIDSRGYAYTTSIYNYMDFQHLVALTGYYSDYGTDIGGNGLFDNLTVDIGVILASEGHCVATGRLVDKTGAEIVWASNTSWLSANLTQIIQLNFEGLSINKHGIDGPYYLKDVYVYHTGDPTQSDYVFDAYTTNAYDYTDFEFPTSVDTSTGTGTAYFVSDSGTIEDLSALNESDLPETNPGADFPHGLFSFNITGLSNGATVNVTIAFPDDIPITAQYWKYNTSSGEWYQISIGSNDGDNIITITLQDGGIGDNDGVENGIINDPGGPGIPITTHLSITLKSGWNLISSPLNLTTWQLGDESMVGDPLNVTPENSLTSIYRYNTTSVSFEKCTHYAGWGWAPATGSESFTELEPGRGYWVMAEDDCNLTFTGTAPSDLGVQLDADWNCIGWYSTSEAQLGNESLVGDPLNVTPENSLTSIYRYNTTLAAFEKCTHYDDWGWAPATGSESFTELEPGRGYWVMAGNDCVWGHEV